MVPYTQKALSHTSMSHVVRVTRVAIIERRSSSLSTDGAVRLLESPQEPEIGTRPVETARNVVT